MTNEEMLERLKKCFTNFRFPGGYQELALTNEKELNSLVIDLLKDIRREKRLIRLAMNSTYGDDAKCPACHRSLLLMGTDARIEAMQLLQPHPIEIDRFKLDNYFIKHYQIEDGKITKAAVVRAKEEPKPKVMFNGPATIFQYGDFKTVVKCDPKDSFDALTGLGVALYRYYRQHKDYKKQYQTLSHFMDLGELVRYALYQFCGWNVSKIRNLDKKLKKFDDGTWITLDI